MVLKISDLKPGDIIEADDGFTCMAAGQHCVGFDDCGAFVKCSHGRHYLDGQENEAGELVGFKRPRDK